MSHTILVQLRRRNNHEEITSILQINSNETINSLSAYLNSILSTNTHYLFFFQNTRILNSLSEIFEKHQISEEETFIIDYMVIEEQPFEWTANFGDTVVALCECKGNVIANTHNRKIYKVEKEPVEFNFQGCKINGIHCVSTDLNESRSNSVFLMENGMSCKSFDDQIVGLASHGEDFAAGLSSKKIILISKEKEEEIQLLDFFRGLTLTEQHLFWIESLNIIFRYEIATGERSQFESPVTFTTLAVFEGVVYAGTSDGMLGVISDDKLTTHPVPIRMCRDIAVFENKIALLSHSRLVILDRVNFTLCGEVVFSDQCNSVVYCEGMLYVAHADEVTVYSPNKIVS